MCIWHLLLALTAGHSFVENMIQHSYRLGLVWRSYNQQPWFSTLTDLGLVWRPNNQPPWFSTLTDLVWFGGHITSFRDSALLQIWVWFGGYITSWSWRRWPGVGDSYPMAAAQGEGPLIKLQYLNSQNIPAQINNSPYDIQVVRLDFL